MRVIYRNSHGRRVCAECRDWPDAIDTAYAIHTGHCPGSLFFRLGFAIERRPWILIPLFILG